jgi:hypothetical protein
MQEKITNWRAKIADGTITLEELRESVIYLRQSRGRPPEAKTKPAKAAAVSKAEIAKVDTSKLLGDLFGIKKD